MVRIMRTYFIFRFSKLEYIPLLIRQIEIMMILRNRQIAITTIASVVVLLAISTVYYNSDVIEAAYAGVTLSSDNVAKTIQVRVTESGTLNEIAYDSFSRVGFVSGETNFLLESIPSKDKKPFYKLVKASIEDKNTRKTDHKMNVAIDLYSGDGEIIQSLEYSRCSVSEYFVHGVDSKGKIFFGADDGTVEIREVTKFSCVGFTLNIDPLNASKVIEDIEQFVEPIESETKEEEMKRLEIERFEYHSTDDPYFSDSPETPNEGDLFYNSMTNILQKFLNGTWIDISGVGGPSSPRK